VKDNYSNKKTKEKRRKER